MKQTIIYFFKYLFFWFIYFIIFRIVFLLANFETTAALAGKDIFGAFLHGFKMDLSIAGYFTMIPGVLLALTAFVKRDVIKSIIKWYTFVLLVVVTAMGLLDIGLFPAWGCRLNGQILPYFNNPKGMLACVSWWQMILVLVSEAGLVGSFFYIFQKVFGNRKKRDEAIRWYATPLMLLLSAMLILPIRGGINTSPLNYSSVYFSETLYANQCAYNYFWTFFYAVTHRMDKTNPVHYMDQKSCQKEMNGLDQLSNAFAPTYIHSKNGKPVNVILVILESFSNRDIEALGGLHDITPRLNQFCHEGITFTSFYSPGNRSDKGISSLIASYPALLKSSSILFFPNKMKKLDCLPTYFAKHGYDMSFFYAGDGNFYNKRMLMIQSGVKKIVTRTEFPIRIASFQKWGVPDEYLYKRMYQDLTQTKQPFFSIVYNISSHEPYDIPDNFNRIPGESNVKKYLNSIAYSDSCLGHFIDQLKKSSMWDNTLVVITADHTAREPGPTTLAEPENYHIPMLWIGGAVDTTMRVDGICMQTDLSPTLVQQMGWKPNPSYFAKNIFGPKQYAFYFHDEGWGFVCPEMACFTNLESGKTQYYYGSKAIKKDSLMRFAQGFTQFLHDDFMKK
jgi:phosphoglycerol transferase MdoB-like AlkP superfamily enzyme